MGSEPANLTLTTLSFLAPTGTFYIRVHALSGAARSQASNEVRIFVNVPGPPPAPTNLLGLANGSFLQLAWRNPDGGGATSGIVLDVVGPVTTSLSLPPSESFSYSGVPAGTYTLAVRAVNALEAAPALTV
jgi:hypothetical protein